MVIRAGVDVVENRKKPLPWLSNSVARSPKRSLVTYNSLTTVTC
jgi:hypothetical protein